MARKSKVDRLPDFEAELAFFSTDEGGRSTPVASGYRPHIHYEGGDTDWGMVFQWDDEKLVRPGEKVSAYCNFFHPWFHRDYLTAGSEFLVREGSRVVATAKITEILFLKDNAEDDKEWLLENDISLEYEHPPKKEMK